MLIEKRIEELGIDLPAASVPAAKYVPAKQTGNLVFLAGQIPVKDGKPLYTGKVGDTVTEEQAAECARQCVINMLSAIKGCVGDLDRVKSVVKVQAFISSKTGFDRQHIVTNAASELLVDVFGEAGMHARTAVGINQLPMDVPVEIEAIVEVE